MELGFVLNVMLFDLWYEPTFSSLYLVNCTKTHLFISIFFLYNQIVHIYFYKFFKLLCIAECILQVNIVFGFLWFFSNDRLLVFMDERNYFLKGLQICFLKVFNFGENFGAKLGDAYFLFQCSYFHLLIWPLEIFSLHWGKSWNAIK